MLGLIDEGTTTKSSVQIAEEQERLGAEISANASIDRTTVSMSALSPNLAPSLDLLADIVRNPRFRARRGGPGQGADSDRHRAGDEGAEQHGLAPAADPALRPGASLCDGRLG
jgi:hypothetical protein